MEAAEPARNFNVKTRYFAASIPSETIDSMETIQQCTIRTGFQLPTEFYYRNNKTGEVMTEPLQKIGDEENFCRRVSKEYGIYENIWSHRRLVPENIDKLILSQNQLSLFLEIQEIEIVGDTTTIYYKGVENGINVQTVFVCKNKQWYLQRTIDRSV